MRRKAEIIPSHFPLPAYSLPLSTCSCSCVSPLSGGPYGCSLFGTQVHLSMMLFVPALNMFLPGARATGAAAPAGAGAATVPALAPMFATTATTTEVGEQDSNVHRTMTV